MREEKIAEVNAKRLKEIKANIAKQKRNQEKAMQHKARVASEEKARIST